MKTAAPKVHEFRSIDLAQLSKLPVSGRLVWSINGHPSGAVDYAPAANTLWLQSSGSAPQQIVLVDRPQNFGGVRQWIECPRCRRLCRVVYGRRYFACRNCCGAKYQSQFDDALSRCWARRWTIRRDLERRGADGSAGLRSLSAAAAGMHLRTHFKLAFKDRSLAASGLLLLQHWGGGAERPNSPNSWRFGP